MAKVLIPLPYRDFDPSEAAISWSVLKRLGHSVAFATPDGQPGRADDMMLTGEGLDIWGFLPGLKRLVAIGRLMRANSAARNAYAAMEQDPAFKNPLPWRRVRRADFDGLLLPGGHRARGMRGYLESEVLQKLVAEFFAAGLPVAAVCHGVLLAARSRAADGRSVLYGRRTTALTWTFERKAAQVGRVVRFWDPDYYRTYTDEPGQPAGFMSVQQEVTARWHARKIFSTFRRTLPTTAARPAAWCAMPSTMTARLSSCATAIMYRRAGPATRILSRRRSRRCCRSAADSSLSNPHIYAAWSRTRTSRAAPSRRRRRPPAADSRAAGRAPEKRNR